MRHVAPELRLLKAAPGQKPTQQGVESRRAHESRLGSRNPPRCPAARNNESLLNHQPLHGDWMTLETREATIQVVVEIQWTDVAAKLSIKNPRVTPTV